MIIICLGEKLLERSSEEKLIVKFVTISSCCRLGLHSCEDYSKHWGALTSPFHSYHKNKHTDV